MRIMGWLIILLSNILITVGAYLLIPAIYCLRKKKLTVKQINRIVVINGICVWLLFRIIIFSLGGEARSGAAVFLWSAVARWLLRRNCAIDDSYYLQEDPNRIVECKSCGYRNKEFFDACPRCGKYTKQYIFLNQTKETDEQNAIPKASGAEISQFVDTSFATEHAEICFCRKCGEKLLEGSIFCRKCGTKVEEVTE